MSYHRPLLLFISLVPFQSTSPQEVSLA